MTHARATVVVAVCAALLLAGCQAEPAPTPAPAAPATPAPARAPAPEVSAFPFAHAASTTPLPSDCRAMLTDAVLAELEDVPLNAPGMGGGVRPDSSRVCVWGEPGALATHLVTVIGYAPRGDALDALNALSADGFTCYEPDAGVRCEKTWTHPGLGVEQGRTLYYRDGVVVDTQFSNLAPAGYTAAVVAALWPAGR